MPPLQKNATCSEINKHQFDDPHNLLTARCRTPGNVRRIWTIERRRGWKKLIEKKRKLGLTNGTYGVIIRKLSDERRRKPGGRHTNHRKDPKKDEKTS